MSSKKTSTTTQNTANSLPDWLKNPYMQATQQATSLAAQPAISAGTQHSLSNLTSDSQNISATGTQALGTLSSLASGNVGMNGQALVDSAAGKYLDPSTNPYIASVANQGADAAQARINAQFGSAGRSNGSGLYAQLFGQGVSNAADQVYYQNYQNERGLQNSAAGTLLNNQQQSIAQMPSIQSAILGGDTAALSAGEYGDKAGLNQLQQYAGILSGLAAPFGQSTMNGTTTQSTSGLGSIIGQIAQLGGAAGSLLGTGGLSSLSSFFKPAGAMNTSGPPAP